VNHFATTEFWFHYRRLPAETRELADRRFAMLQADPRRLHMRLPLTGRTPHAERAPSTVVDGNDREAHMIRSICAVVIAVVGWFVAATLGNWLLRALLPGYSGVETAMAFTFPMQLGRLAVGLVSSLCAGALCAALARPNSHADKLVAGLMVVLFLPVHYALWAKFPVWYHVFFLASLVPVVLAGAALHRKFAAVIIARTPRANTT